MIELVRHTLLLSTVRFNVHIVADIVGLHKRGQLDGTTLYIPTRSANALSDSQRQTFKAPLEHVARSRTITKRVRHGCPVDLISVTDFPGN